MTDSPTPQAIFFDLDDTIIDFSGPAGPAWIETTKGFADAFGDIDPATVCQTIHQISSRWWSDPERHRLGRLDLRNTRIRNIADALTELGIAGDGDLATRMADTFTHLRTEGLTLFPGARETLQHFHDTGVPMAMITNGDSLGQRHKIQRFDLEGFFECILIEEEFGVGKPDDSVFLHALEQLGSPPQHTWMVGDNPQWEIAPCRRLGLHTVWVDVQGQGQIESQQPGPHRPEPHRTVRRIRELVA